MVEYVKLNGTPIRVTGLYRQTIEPGEGAALEEIELVVVLRGEATHRAFLDLLERPPIHLDIPDERAFAAALVSSTWTESGEGDASAYRHDLTLREQPPSEATAMQTDDPVVTVEEAALADDEAGEVPLEAVASEPLPSTPAPDSPSQPKDSTDPLVRLGLRLEALIEALARAGVVELAEVDAAYARLTAGQSAAGATGAVADPKAVRELPQRHQVKAVPPRM